MHIKTTKNNTLPGKNQHCHCHQVSNIHHTSLCMSKPFKNGGRGIKPTYIVMVSNWSSFYWWSSSSLLLMVIQVMIFIGSRNLALSMLCNIIPIIIRHIIIHLQISIAVTERVRNLFNLVFFVFLQQNSGVFTGTKLFLSLNQPNQPVKNIKYIDKISIKPKTNTSRRAKKINWYFV